MLSLKTLLLRVSTALALATNAQAAATAPPVTDRQPIENHQDGLYRARYTDKRSQSLSIVESNIAELQLALSNGHINAVQLLAKHLHRVAQFDRRGPRLNSLPVISERLFEEALSSDDYRASHNGTGRSAVEGLPFTVKDSYMLAGLTVAAGSPAFQNLTAHEDAFTVGELRAAGAIAMGKTNMPPMANGGMQRGLYGRADSPYNFDYLTAAMGSGPSNGCGTSTSSSMAVFGMGEETVSSGRSPASNNGLVAYTPSRGVLSIRGNWPLSPEGNVVVPFTRHVKDLLALLDVLVHDDSIRKADLWRGQDFVHIPPPESMRPASGSFLSLADPDAVRGKRVGLPRMFSGNHDSSVTPVYVREGVLAVLRSARDTLESLGAVVEDVEFPLVTNYEIRPTTWQTNTSWPLPSYANDTIGPAALPAYAMDDFLHMVSDPSSIHNFLDVDTEQIFPQLPGTLPDRYGNRVGRNRTTSNGYYTNGLDVRNGTAINGLPGLGHWLQSLEARRKRDLEDWMDRENLDFLVWPANGDTAPQDSETNETSSEIAWRNGVARSLGNYAIRQLGVPTLNVNMGMVAETGMPVDLTFAGRAWDDKALLSYSYAFEQAHQFHRIQPVRVPTLPTDTFALRCGRQWSPSHHAPELNATAIRTSDRIHISGSVASTDCITSDVEVEVFLDGIQTSNVIFDQNAFRVDAEIILDSPGVSRFGEVNSPDIDKAMVVIIATAKNGRSSGKLIFA